MTLDDLKKPFAANEIEWRIGRCGDNNGQVWATALAYIQSRAVMDRLDAVCGPENWRNEFAPGPQGGVMCGISIRLNGEWVTKWDGAENTDIESVKGGISDSMKRAAVQWGIGRYLYQLDEGFLDNISMEKKPVNQGWRRAATKDRKAFWWQAPELPEWALPRGDKPQQGKQQGQQPQRRAPQAKQKPPSSDYEQVRGAFKDVGCKTAEDADACVKAVTSAKYATAAELKDNPQACKEFMDAYGKMSTKQRQLIIKPQLSSEAPV